MKAITISYLTTGIRLLISAIFFILGILLFWPKNLLVYAQEIGSDQNKPRYVSNQIIVRYEKDAIPAKIEEQSLARQERAQSFGGQIQNFVENQKLKLTGEETPEKKLELLEETKEDLGVVKAENVLSENPTTSGQSVLGAQDVPESSEFVLYKTDGRKSVEEMMKIFESLPGVAHVEPNLIFHATDVVPNDPYYPDMWGLRKIEMEKAWDITKGSNDVIVAVVDSGVDYNHEDFSGRIFADGYDFTTCDFISVFSGRCLDENEKTRDNDPMDENGHGTHVTGTIGAVANNSLGVSGINWNLTIIPLRVLNVDGIGLETDIVDAIRYAVDHGADIINLSLAADAPCESAVLYQEVVNYAYNRGVAVIVAAGNSDDGQDVANIVPASCQHVIAVAATGTEDERAPFSNYGQKVDLAAPGNNIKSTGFDRYNPDVLHRYYTYKQGTSMACPHVVGVAALMKAVNHSLKPDEIETLLKNNTDQFPNSPDHPIGTGRLNAFKALSAIGRSETTPSPTPTPTAVCPAGNNGNLNCDVNGKINEVDFCLLLKYWVPNGPVPPVPPEYHTPDLNNDEKVEVEDKKILLNNWIP